MSMDDDFGPLAAGNRPAFEPANVETLSIEELRAYIEHAKQEIERAQGEIESRQSLLGAADALFRK